VPAVGMRYCHKAMMLDLSGMASFRRKLLAIVLPVLLLGCSSTGHTPPRPELVLSGWRDPSALAPGADFETYIRDVSQELRKHRLPFVASMADAELGKVAPFRQLPDRGCKADVVHAKDEPARQWYLHWEFEPSPSDPFHLFLLMKDIKAIVGKA